ncbi:MAG: hypothetical protein ACI9VR_002002 [Cognaticolwellia sp.]
MPVPGRSASAPPEFPGRWLPFPELVPVLLLLAPGVWPPGAVGMEGSLQAPLLLGVLEEPLVPRSGWLKELGAEGT